MANNKILCVDDDDKILKGIQRQLGDDFEITIALGPLQALEIFDDEGPFAVVVSDMRMPEMNGVELLKRIRDRSPNTVRMMLTGFAELNSTIEAVNDGHIFRFLAKPCNEEILAASLRDGLKQFALVEGERELVEGTLHGCIKVLSEVLSLVNPLAFGQSTRVRATVDGMLKRLEVKDQWQLEIAAMLSSLGCVTLPEDLLKKKFAGEKLDAIEEKIVGGHPAIAGELLHSIPRLDKVAEFIAHQQGPLKSVPANDSKVSLESQILKIAIDFDFEELRSESSLHALNEIKLNNQQYSPAVFDALSDFINTERNLCIEEISLRELREGMVLASDICDLNGKLLMSKGQEITSSATRLLGNFTKNNSVVEPILIVNSQPAEVA